MPFIIINSYSGGPTGHMNVTFSDNAGNRVTYGNNWEGTLDHPLNGVRNEDSKLSDITRVSTDPIEVTQAQYDAALQYAEDRAAARDAGQDGYEIGGGNCVDFADQVLRHVGYPPGSIATMRPHDATMAEAYASTANMLYDHNASEVAQLEAVQNAFAGLLGVNNPNGWLNPNNPDSPFNPNNPNSPFNMTGDNGLFGPNGALRGFGLIGGWLMQNNPFNYPPISPLVLDLDGDGLDLTDITNSSAYFDLDQDGDAEHTAWIGADDAFLALDVNADGHINDLSELFGGKDVDGFTRLAAHDSNHDGIINASDSVWSQLKLWRDLDGDGLTDPGELQAVPASTVTQIDLDAAFVDRWEGGNWISHESTCGTASGGSAAIFDVWFENSQLVTIHGYGDTATLNADALKLPTLQGFGDLPHLHLSTSADSALRAKLQALVMDAATLDADELRAGIENLLLDWANVDATPANSRGANIDARHLAFLEELHGADFVAWNSLADPGPNAGRALEHYYQQVVDYMGGQLISQFSQSYFMLTGSVENMATYALNVFAGIGTHGESDRVSQRVDLAADRLADLFDKAIDSGEAAELERAIALISILPMVAAPAGPAQEGLAAQFGGRLAALGVDANLREFASHGLATAFRIGTDSADSVMAAAGEAGLAALLGDGQDTFGGTTKKDVVIGGAGNDVLRGEDGDDTFVWVRGDGNDTITEAQNGGAADKLILSGVAAADITALTRSGNDVSLTIAGTGGGVIKLVGNLDESYGRGVDQIVLSDAAWTREDLRLKLLAQLSTSGADTISGYNTADTITAGGGNDVLRGEDGSDTFIWARGDGNDTITEGANDGSADKLVLSGISAADITALTRSGNDVSLTIAGTGGGVIKLVGNIDEYFDRGIDQIVLSDATWTREDLRARLIDLAGTPGHDTITGSNISEIISGGVGNDVLRGEDGDDTFLWARGDGNDTITEAQNGGAADKLILSGVAAADITALTRSGNDVSLTIAGTGGGVIKLVGNLDESYGRGVDQIVLSDAAWTREDLRLKLLAQLSTSGADTISGYNTADTITAGGGNDVLRGEDGDDTFVWVRGDGNDTITEAQNGGSADKLVLSGVSAADITALTRSGNDVSLTIAGTGGGVIKLVGNLDESYSRGVDQIVFSDATWTREDLRLRLLAQLSTPGADTISGYNTADLIDGAAGGDSLSGADGDDTLIGRSGADTIAGGSGNDVFRIDGAADSAPTGRDLITAFTHGGDKIDLRGIDADMVASGDQAFAWIASAAFSGVAGQLRYEMSPSGARTIYGDIDGDTVADLAIQVTGSASFQATDFLL